MEVESVYSAIMMKLSNTDSLNANYLDLYGESVKLHALANATKSLNLWKGLVQSTYILQHPHSRVTNQGRRAAAARTGTGETEAGANWRRRSWEKSTRGHKGGQQQFLQ
jgi:hypothetical protein